MMSVFTILDITVINETWMLIESASLKNLPKAKIMYFN